MFSVHDFPRPLPKDISDHYLVVLSDDSDPEALASELGVKVDACYTAVMKGFSCTLSEEQANALQAHPSVEDIELDKKCEEAVYRQHLDENGDPWGLDRIDDLKPAYDFVYHYNLTGKGVKAYVLDTGMEIDHPEFEDRASTGFDCMGKDGRDVDGHGTHVAGTIGGAKYGVAKDVELINIKVLRDDGRGTLTDIVKGLDYIAKTNSGRAVVNMSLGAPFSRVLNRAMKSFADAGIPVVAAAGNSGIDAAKASPASSEDVITVGASTRRDFAATWSNWGERVDLWAPGLHVVSASPGGRVDQLSGTSMAAPHVAGIVALILEENKLITAKEVKRRLLEFALPDRLQRLPESSPNLLANKSTL